MKGDGDTAREAHDDGVGDELDDCPQPESAQHDEDDTCHQRGGNEARLAILLDDAVDDDDECACRSAYLHLAATQQRDEETRDDGRHDALLGRDTRRDAEGDGQRQGHDAHDDARHQVGGELLLVVALQCVEQLGSEFKSFHCLSVYVCYPGWKEAAKLGKNLQMKHKRRGFSVQILSVSGSKDREYCCLWAAVPADASGGIPARGLRYRCPRAGVPPLARLTRAVFKADILCLG